MENINFEKLEVKKENVIEKNVGILTKDNIEIYIEDCLIFLKFNLFETEEKSEIAYKIVKVLFEVMYFKEEKVLKNFLLKVYNYSKVKNIDYFIKIFEKSTISCGTKIESKYFWENEICKEYENEINKYKTDKIFSLNKVYNLISVVERSMGFYNFEIGLLIQLIRLDDYKKIKKCYDNSNDLIKIIISNNFLAEKEKLFFAKESSNLLVKIESVRNINKYFLEEKNEFIEKDYKETYSGIILELINNKNWKEYLSFFIKERSFAFFFILGEILVGIDREKQLFVVANVKYQNLDKNYEYTFKEERKYLNLFKNLDKLSKDIRESISESYFKEILNLENCFSLVYNNMTINLLNMYYIFDCNLEEIKKIIDELEEIDNIWFESFSEKTTTIFKKYSCLFVLTASLVNEKSISFEKKNLLIRLEESFKKNFFKIKKENNASFPLIQTFKTYILEKIKE